VRSVGFLSLFLQQLMMGMWCPTRFCLFAREVPLVWCCTVVHETLSVSYATAFACRRPGGLGSVAPQSPRPTEHCLVNTCTFRLG
jgi:hypothetical protein